LVSIKIISGFVCEYERRNADKLKERLKVVIVKDMAHWAYLARAGSNLVLELGNEFVRMERHDSIVMVPCHDEDGGVLGRFGLGQVDIVEGGVGDEVLEFSLIVRSPVVSGPGVANRELVVTEHVKNSEALILKISTLAL
jgi:hypothetical protein